MASKTEVPQDEFDATKRQQDSIPAFVRIPTGEVEVTDDGDLVLENGEPKFKSQAFLVRRTGDALKMILKREIELQTQHQQQQEEEDDAFKVEDDGGAKVDLDWLSERQQARSQEAIDLTYFSLSLLLCNPVDGTNPQPEELSKTLDYLTAASWMRKFVPPPVTVPVTDEDGKVTERKESPTEAGSATALGVGS